MKTFTDNTGRAWNVTIDVGALMRIRDLCSVDAGDMREIAKVLLRLRFDELFVAEIAYAIVFPQCTEAKLGRPEFFAAMGKDANSGAEAAIAAEFPGFFRNPAARDMAARAVEATARIRDALMTETASPPSTSSTTPSSLPESPESTPEASPSTNSTS